MNGFLLRIFALLFLALGCADAAVRGVMSSQFLVRGEVATFEIRVVGRNPDRMPLIPAIKGVEIETIGLGRPQGYPGRPVESSLQYTISSYTVGKYVIPAIDVSVGGQRLQTQPIPFEVFEPTDLEWKEVESKPAGDVIKYATLIKVPERKYFENQSMAAEIKVFIPQQLEQAVADWGVPEFERKGLAAWRFEPSEMRGEVNLLGRRYSTRSYPTTMSALDSGEVEIGPATVRLTYQKIIYDRFTQRVGVEATLEVDKLSFHVNELPGGAPSGFDNAVGDFTIDAELKQSEVTEGEPVAIDVVVSGTGNLDSLRSPKMIDDNGWKVYDATPTQRGEERRNLTGSVVFSQFIRPLEMKTGIPPFQLVFFNPDTETYETVATEPIPLKMIAAAGGKNFESSGPPPALSLPVERMTDILGIVQGKPLLAGPQSEFPWRIAHLVAGIAALLLIARALWLKYGHLLEKDHEKIRRRKDFQEVLKSATEDGVGFLRAAGAFVEKWLSTEKDPDLRLILEERDRLCFTKTKDEVALPRRRRDEILKSIRRAAFCVAFMALGGFLLGNAQAQDTAVKAVEAYESAKYEEAAKLWLGAGSYEQLSADTLFNIGNAAYRMGEPGQAALYFRRALVRDASHQEAQQNLRFIERKYGSITVGRPAYQLIIAKIPLVTWKNLLWFGSWLLLLGLLVFPATRRGSKWRVAGVVSFIAGPLLMSIGWLGWRHFPDDSNFAALENQAVIVGQDVVLHTDAARASKEVIDAPPGSIAEVLQRSGRWAYVSFATQTRGWVPIEAIEMVIPDKKPEPPKHKKSSADGSSA